MLCYFFKENLCGAAQRLRRQSADFFFFFFILTLFVFWSFFRVNRATLTNVDFVGIPAQKILIKETEHVFFFTPLINFWPITVMQTTLMLRHHRGVVQTTFQQLSVHNLTVVTSRNIGTHVSRRRSSFCRFLTESRLTAPSAAHQVYSSVVSGQYTNKPSQLHTISSQSQRSPKPRQSKSI